MQLHSLAHGVIVLDHLAIDYGAERRRLEVKKLRGSRFRGGFHDFRIRTGGLDVYPRLQMAPASEPLDDQSARVDHRTSIVCSAAGSRWERAR